MKFKFTLEKRRAKKDGTYPVVLDVWNQNRIRLATPYSALPEEWDDEKFFNKKAENYARKNIILSQMKNEVDKLILSLEEEKKRVMDKILRPMLSEIISPQKKTEKQEKCFVDYLDEFVSRKTKENTKGIYLGTKNKILEYDGKCTFDTIDRKWLERFEDWMAKSGMKVNSIGIHLRNIRAVFNYAIDEDITKCYPFRKFKIKKEATRKRCLSVDQFRTLIDYPCEEYQKRYRDIFVLMFYLIGINAVDLFSAKQSDIVNGRLEYKRAKTGKLYSVLLQPEAIKIMEMYCGDEYILNVKNEYKNYKDFLHRMGIGLRKIGEMERVGRGGKKIISPLFSEISSYWARHTWATIAASLDIPKETISAALGHEIGSRVTSIYIDFDQKKVDEANRKVIDYVLYGIR